MKKGLIILGCLFLLSGCSVKNQLEQKIEDKIDKVENKKDNAKSNLKTLLGLGKSQKCSWKYDDGQQSMEGELLFKNEKFRQTVSIKQKDDAQKNVKMITVSDGEYFYSWDPSKKTDGIKIKLNEEDKEKAEDKNNSVDMEKEYNYNCTDWNVSDNDLTPPSDIKFVDIMAEMQKFGDQLQDMLKDIPSITPEE